MRDLTNFIRYFETFIRFKNCIEDFSVSLARELKTKNLE